MGKSKTSMKAQQEEASIMDQWKIRYKTQYAYTFNKHPHSHIQHALLFEDLCYWSLENKQSCGHVWISTLQTKEIEKSPNAKPKIQMCVCRLSCHMDGYIISTSH